MEQYYPRQQGDSMSYYRLVLLLVLGFSWLHAFSTSNIQYLYGSFDDNTMFDTTDKGKSTITGEHYRTHAYGDLFAFFDYEIAPDGFYFHPDETRNFYFEVSPRISLSKVSGSELSSGFFKDFYASFQYNRQIIRNNGDFDAWLYGAGTDLDVPGFQVFGLNAYRKNQTIQGFDLPNTYQFSGNYISAKIAGTQLYLDGFFDWTEEDFLTQNQLLYDFDKIDALGEGSLKAGTEWHYYRVKDSDGRSQTWQLMVKVVW
jgi:nucleoside-specific outer membrane channel protein Tsx